MSANESRSRPLIRLLKGLLTPLVWLERARGRRRMALACVYLIVIASVGLFAWRTSSLGGLPDVGDPFDVEAFTTVEITAEENAFTFYRQALAKLRPMENASRVVRLDDFDWSRAEPDLRRWVEENQEAMALWRLGANRPRAVDIQPGDLEISTPLRTSQNLREFARLGLLDASRLEQAGDLAGAWERYRAALRSSRHVGMVGGMVARLIGGAMLRLAIPRITAWAEDPRVDAGLLRRAVAEVRACEAMTPPPSEMIRVEYLVLHHELKHMPRWVVDEACPQSVWYYHLPRVAEARLWLRREPERSGRVIKLIFADWLAYCDRPPGRRPGLVPGVSIPMLFRADATAPAGARALSPETLDAWYQSAPLARIMLPEPSSVLGRIASEPGQLRSLQVTLAEQCYRREHGGAPPTRLGELVGRYLDALPEGYADDDPPVTSDEASSDENGQP